jgi:hypothetical protein
MAPNVNIETVRLPDIDAARLNPTSQIRSFLGPEPEGSIPIPSRQITKVAA